MRLREPTRKERSIMVPCSELTGESNAGQKEVMNDGAGDGNGWTGSGISPQAAPAVRAC